MSLLDDFLTRAILAGLGVVLAAAPLGCFVVWRRMAYFGDATAHAAMLGVALALTFNISVIAGVLAVSFIMALTVSLLDGRGLAIDTLLGVMAHSSLAIGLVAVSFIQGARVDLNAYLFGDILAVNRTDVAVIWGGAALVLALLAWRWQALLTATLNPDLAASAGISPLREQVGLSIALALVVGTAIKVVGVLLIVALLLIPAAAARPFARSPEAMALIALGVGALSVTGGIGAAYQFDTPTGPTIVSTAAVIFAVVSLARVLRRA
ncbi:metal ABC transporter permease [Celeribacter sp.]|uniref:metal ABC transporter permease n=1 Tax=Celeribacter sp. TaxID=1890673 RepID=UPI003A8D41D5